jgi:hypothetical protein
MDVSNRDALRDSLYLWYLQYGTRDIDYFLAKKSTGFNSAQFFYIKNNLRYIAYCSEVSEDYLVHITPKGLEFIKNGT